MTITLSGELGAGKTTFLQGFLAEMGISDHVVSPTYALEQQYFTPETEEKIVHIDLYRLKEHQAKQFLEESEQDFSVRCIEWPERAGIQGDIHIKLSEQADKEGRQLEVSFRDFPLPEQSQIDSWRNEVELPEHIIAHCNGVGAFAKELGVQMVERGIITRPNALEVAGKLHDLLRFVDFRDGSGHERAKEDENPPGVWKEIQERYSGMRHEPACATFLEEQGFCELASIVAVHGLRLPPESRVTLEQKLVYYADKRMMVDKKVSLQERFADFATRYKGKPEETEGNIWYTQAKTVEEELGITE